MSGPIVRKYGFPNFDKIFGAKEVPHGRDDTTAAASPSSGSPATNSTAPDASSAADRTATSTPSSPTQQP
jgi:hypothetical protein